MKSIKRKWRDQFQIQSDIKVDMPSRAPHPLSSFQLLSFLTCIFKMTGGPHAALAPGHFLFTSESVGEGHPGMSLFAVNPPAHVFDTWLSLCRQDL